MVFSWLRSSKPHYRLLATICCTAADKGRGRGDRIPGPEEIVLYSEATQLLSAVANPRSFLHWTTTHRPAVHFSRLRSGHTASRCCGAIIDEGARKTCLPAHRHSLVLIVLWTSGPLTESCPWLSHPTRLRPTSVLGQIRKSHPRAGIAFSSTLKVQLVLPEAGGNWIPFRTDLRTFWHLHRPSETATNPEKRLGRQFQSRLTTSKSAATSSLLQGTSRRRVHILG